MTKAKSLVTLVTEKVLSLVPLDDERYDLVDLLLECEVADDSHPYQARLMRADSRIQGIADWIFQQIASHSDSFVTLYTCPSDCVTSRSVEIQGARVMRAFEEFNDDWFTNEVSFSDSDGVGQIMKRFVLLVLIRETQADYQYCPREGRRLST